MNKHEWQPFLPSIKPGYAPWLQDHGSLTLRIQRCCIKFEVQREYEGMAKAARDECALLGVPQQKLVYTREVFLYADNSPVVFAHSVVASQHLRGAWRALKHLGNRPLAALLFAHPLVHRNPLHFCQLKSDHLLYRRAIVPLIQESNQDWQRREYAQKLFARRSVFTLESIPLLVTEVFLPKILLLKNKVKISSGMG